MKLKEFVKSVIIDLSQAVSEASKETEKKIVFKGVKGQRTAIEFDIAVTVESSKGGRGGGEIKVWGIAQVDGNISAELKNSTVSRVSFGVDISELNKQGTRRND